MIPNTDLILFLDIETALIEPIFQKLTEEQQKPFLTRFKRQIDEAYNAEWLKTITLIAHKDSDLIHDCAIDLRRSITQEIYKENGPFFAEYSRVVCVSIGSTSKGTLSIKAIADNNESLMLSTLSKIMDFEILHEGATSGHPKYQVICAHNGKEFDFPFLLRRFVINRLPIPRLLKTYGLKPWETSFLDTMEMWKGSSYRYSVSLSMLAIGLGLPSPKENMDGSMVGQAFIEGRLSEIASYCNIDTITLVNCFMIMIGKEPFAETAITVK